MWSAALPNSSQFPLHTHLIHTRQGFLAISHARGGLCSRGALQEVRRGASKSAPTYDVRGHHGWNTTATLGHDHLRLRPLVWLDRLCHPDYRACIAKASPHTLFSPPLHFIDRKSRNVSDGRGGIVECKCATEAPFHNQTIKRRAFTQSAHHKTCSVISQDCRACVPRFWPHSKSTSSDTHTPPQAATVGRTSASSL